MAQAERAAQAQAERAAQAQAGGAAQAELRRGLRVVVAGTLRAAQARAREIQDGRLAGAAVTMRDLRVLLFTIKCMGTGRPFQAFLSAEGSPPPTLDELRDAHADSDAFYDRAMRWLHMQRPGCDPAVPFLVNVVDAMLAEAEWYCAREDDVDDMDLEQDLA